MKKTLLAAALLAGFAGAAHAQSSVTLYGIIDAGFNWTKTGQGKSRLGLDSGIDYQSRIGVRGTEDLGNGLKAIFNLEQGLNTDTGTQLNGRMWGRHAYVGLESARLGRLVLGRTTNFQYGWAAGIINPFGLGFGNASARNTLAYNDWDLNGGWTNNSVYYYSPVIAGFQGGIGYSFQNSNAADGESALGTGYNNRLLDLGLKYANGPLNAVATYQYVFSGDGYNSLAAAAGGHPNKNFSNLTVGANYNFGIATVYAGYANVHNIHNFSSVAGIGSTSGVGGYNGYTGDIYLPRDNVYTVGAAAPIGPGKAMVAYQKATRSYADNVSLGYVYALSKRTGVYGLYSWGHVYSATADDNKQTSQQAGVGLYTMF